MRKLRKTALPALPARAPGRVLHHLLLEPVRVLVPLYLDGALRADDDALAAADAPVPLDGAFFCRCTGRWRSPGSSRGRGRTLAPLHVDRRADGDVLHQLALPCGAAHAHVLERAAEAAKLVPLEVGHHDEGVRIDDLPRDAHLMEHPARRDRHLDAGRAPQPVRDDDGASDHRSSRSRSARPSRCG